MPVSMPISISVPNPDPGTPEFTPEKGRPDLILGLGHQNPGRKIPTHPDLIPRFGGSNPGKKLGRPYGFWVIEDEYSSREIVGSNPSHGEILKNKK